MVFFLFLNQSTSHKEGSEHPEGGLTTSKRRTGVRRSALLMSAVAANQCEVIPSLATIYKSTVMVFFFILKLKLSYKEGSEHFQNI
jgi:hypothetical protein